VQALDPQTNILATTNTRQDFPFIGLTASMSKTLGSQTLNATNNVYANTSPGNSGVQVFLTQSQTASADLDGTPLPTVTTSCGFRFNPAGCSDVKPAGIPI
jgi:hypothetical protein